MMKVMPFDSQAFLGIVEHVGAMNSDLSELFHNMGMLGLLFHGTS